MLSLRVKAAKRKSSQSQKSVTATSTEGTTCLFLSANLITGFFSVPIPANKKPTERVCLPCPLLLFITQILKVFMITVLWKSCSEFFLEILTNTPVTFIFRKKLFKCINMQTSSLVFYQIQSGCLQVLVDAPLCKKELCWLQRIRNPIIYNQRGIKLSYEDNWIWFLLAYIKDHPKPTC